MILENGLILKSIDSFLRKSIANTEDMITPKKMREIEMTRLIFNDLEECYTTGKTIVIGKEFPVFKHENSHILYRQVQGVVIHELAHILYTNFRDFTTFVNTAPRIYKRNKDIAKNVLNILEDYRIERKMGETNSFYKKLFLMVRFHIVERISKMLREQEIKTDSDRVNILMNSLLLMGFIGQPIKTNDVKTNELMMVMCPLVKEATAAETTKEVVAISDKVMKLLSEINASDDDILFDSDIKKLIGKLKGTGTNDPVEKQEIATSDLDGYINGDRDQPDIKAVMDITKNIEEASRKAEEILNELSSEIKNEVERIDRNDLTGKIINDYLSEHDKEMARVEIGKEEKEIEELKKELPPLHSGKIINVRKDVTLERYSSVVYDSLKDSLESPIRQTSNKLEEIKHMKIDDWSYSKKSGIVDTNSLVRLELFDDIDIFKTPYIEEKNLAMDVMLLIDCSGSNSSEVLNIKNHSKLPRYKVNQMIAVFIHETLKRVQWRHSIWGFDSGSKENIAPIIPFNSCYDKKSGLKIRNIGARNANRDGLHIRMAGKHLAGHAETNRKLLIVLSDGQPSSTGYRGEAAMKDIFDSTQELKTLGVKTIGIFSGSEEENKYFRAMYENHLFLNNDSIHEFPAAFYELLIKEFDMDNDSL